MSDGNKDDVGRSRPKRKPIWPWLVLLAVTLMMIYAYNEALEMFDGLGQTGRDFVQLFKWLLSVVEG